MDETQETLSKNEKRELAKQQKEEARMQEEKSQKMKTWLTIALVLGAIGFVVFKLWQFMMTPTAGPSQPIEFSDADWVKGAKDTKAILIEYGDFECPACAIYYPEIKKLENEFGEKLTLVYRHYPLTQIHKKAFPAARASEAAGKFGKFWEMHDILYEKQEDWTKSSNTDEKFVEYAKSIGLNEEEFKKAYESKEFDSKINADVVSGNQLRIQGTPSYFLNGKKIQPRGYEDFKKQIEAALAQ